VCPLTKKPATAGLFGKSQIPSNKSQAYISPEINWLNYCLNIGMATPSNNVYDLEKRTFIFAKNVREYVAKLPKSLTNAEFGRQLIRSAGSVGANYIEADEALSRKDFIMRIKICKKEAKESRYWLELSLPIKTRVYVKS